MDSTTRIKSFGLFLSLALASPTIFAATNANNQVSTDAVAESARVEVEHVQRAIARSAQAQWTATTTSMTVLSQEERMKRLGVNIPNLGNRQYSGVQSSSVTYPAQLTGGSTPPAKFDWRNVNGHSYVTSIKNQGSCGSCWAFASTAALESKALISMNTPDVDMNLAEQLMVSCSGAGSCNGGQVNRAADYLQSTGDASESVFPYTGKDTACTSAQSGWQSNAFKISNWQYVHNKYTRTPNKLTVEMIKDALYNSGPLPATFNVYSDFYSYRSGVYSVTSTSFQGRHAVTIVGYDDAAKALIAKNSWGTGWGENGYFRVGYNQIDGSGSTMEFGQEVLAYGSTNTPGSVCLYALSQTSQTAPALGLTGSVNLTVTSSGTSCNWTAVSSANWITITGGASGSGNGKISFEVAANTSTQSRNGTISVGGQTYTITQAAAANPLPNCTLAASSTSVKAGTAVTLTTSCTPAATSYSWTNASFATSAASGKVTPTKTTTYSVKGSNNAGSSAVASVTVAVATEPPPSCTLAASASSVVPGTAVKLTATCTPAATTFNWSNTGFTNKVATGSVKPASTTTYSVSGSNANGTGSVANVVVSVVKPAPPSCSLTASSTNVVAGNSVTLTAKCIPVASSYVWTNTSFASQAATGAVKPTTSTTYSVSGVNAGGTGEVAKATVTVTNPKPLAPSQLTSPSGVVTTATPAFSWNAAAGATSYTLKLVSPSNSMVLKMSAASWGCGNGTGVCAVKPAQALQGNVTYTWSVIASNAAGDSPESAKKNFKVALSKDGKLYPAGNYEAGPISTNTQAQQVCPPVCSAKGLKWGGNWSTTVAGKMSVCGCSL